MKRRTFILAAGLTFQSMRTASLCALFLIACRAFAQGTPDPLPSWSDGAAKQAIIGFVKRVTNEGGPDFVPVASRIATFDNDGNPLVAVPEE